MASFVFIVYVIVSRAETHDHTMQISRNFGDLSKKKLQFILAENKSLEFISVFYLASKTKASIPETKAVAPDVWPNDESQAVFVVLEAVS